jgi:hypothetical protein
VDIFISWSGPQSLQVAQALRQWLPRVLQAVRPYLSTEDTVKGAYWVSEVRNQLDTAKFGIICLTPDNLQAPWINFEAGALSNSFERGSVTPFLFHVSQADLTGPLTQFQVTEAASPSDVLRLLKQLDKACVHPVGEHVVEDSFQMWWAPLEKVLQGIKVPQETSQRSMEDMVLEILTLARAQRRQLADPSYREMEVLVRQAVTAPGPDLVTELEDALEDLSNALDACADSDDPAIRRIIARAAAVRVVYDKLTGRGAEWEPLWKRVNPEQRGPTAGGS